MSGFASSISAACASRLRRSVAAAVSLAALAFALPAQAACTGVGVFTCGATVSVALPLAFGNYNPASDKTGSTDVSVTSSVYGVGILVTVSYSISLSAGAGGTLSNRVLQGPGTLAYNLYTSDTYRTVWGDNGVTDSISAVASVGGNSVTRVYTAYGLIPAGQYVASGSYSNTITVSVLY